MKVAPAFFVLLVLLLGKVTLASESTDKHISQNTEHGEIIVYRLRGGSRREILTIAREDVAALRSNRHIHLYAKPGLRRFIIMPTGGSASIEVEAGKTYYLKVTNKVLDSRVEVTGSSVVPVIGRTNKTPRFFKMEEDIALTEIKKTKRAVTEYRYYEEYYPGVTN
ncbi:MAG: hypothetical protein AAF542_25995 [Pseudomonadota bacterium]